MHPGMHPVDLRTAMPSWYQQSVVFYRLTTPSRTALRQPYPLERISSLLLLWQLPATLPQAGLGDSWEPLEEGGILHVLSWR